MKTWQRWLLGIGGFLVLAFIAGIVIYSHRGVDYHTGKPIGYVMEGQEGRIRWAKNSQALYFYARDRDIRYDLRSGRSTTVLHGQDDLSLLDVSPDDTQLLCRRGKHDLGIFDLKTQRYTSLAMPHYLGVQFYDVHWLASNRILLIVQEDLSKPGQLRLIDPVHRTMIPVLQQPYEFYAAADGSGFTYHDKQGVNYYYNFAQNRTTIITSQDIGSWRYLSRHYAIYDSSDSDKLMVTDLITMTTRSLTPPVRSNHMEFSPDMTKYYYVDDVSGSFDFPFSYDAPYHIFIADTPAAELRKLTK